MIGLEGAVADALAQHLQQLNLPLGVGGEIVFEFAVSKRRVRRIMLDEDASTLKETAVIYLIKQSLSTWRVSPSTTSIVRITLSIQF